ncbi:hypothetical protein CcCBS67573_g08741 [Chytriomyces confervae]|uniref:Menorin-like domain-containing protein n=1 Tax=Chytriomyces confervae TaxID=246404 RepID=A0A507EG32_9FUNG|nr:hypothetical protein CcCBS67573_g08741 [Chytriomyces confervae]
MIGLKPASDYKWGHAINSQLLLDQTVKDASVNAIEADIIYSENQQQAVMGHPPQTRQRIDSGLVLAAAAPIRIPKSSSANDFARYVEKTQFPLEQC